MGSGVLSAVAGSAGVGGAGAGRAGAVGAGWAVSGVTGPGDGGEADGATGLGLGGFGDRVGRKLGRPIPPAGFGGPDGDAEPPPAGASSSTLVNHLPLALHEGQEKGGIFFSTRLPHWLQEKVGMIY